MAIKSIKKFIIQSSLVLLLSTLVNNSSGQETKTITLSKGDAQRTSQRLLQAGATHRYRIALAMGDFVHININQSGIDVIARVSTPNNEVQVFDSPTGELDPEDIYLLSNSGGKYDILISPAQKYADPGTYKIKVSRWGKASESEKKWMIALEETQKGDQLRDKADTRPQSLLQYEAALTLWKELKDPRQYANTQRSLGFVYIREKKYEKALEIFEQLKQSWHKLNDIRSEGFTYLIIGRIYDLQKNYSKSLDCNLSSLLYWRRAKDPDQESFVLMNIGNLYSHLQNKQNSLDYFKQALKKNEGSKRPSVKAVILRDYATAMLSFGEDQKAIQLFDQSLKQWHLTVNKPEEAHTAGMIAGYFGEKKNKQKSIYYYQYALEIWKKLNEEKEIKNVQLALDKLENK